MSAASNGHLECLLLLMQRGADVRHSMVKGSTAAHFAAHRGDVEMLRVLFASGADLLALAGGLSVVDNACLASPMDAASFALACGCRFVLTCREITLCFMKDKHTLFDLFDIFYIHQISHIC